MRWSSFFLSGLLLAAPVQAQGVPTGAAISRDARASIIEAVASRLTASYIEADTGRMIGEAVRRKLADGAYDGLDNPAQFANAVTRDLRALNGDLHLSLRYAPEGSPARNLLGDPRRQNFGLGRIEILPGNVGYLEITAFAGAPGYREAVGDALRLLERTDAIIIDVRRNGGGSGEMSHLVFSHFLGTDPVPTIAVKRRGQAQPQVRTSVSEVPGPRRTDVPLYLLTSRWTASAAEEFSFVLKNRQRARIVGSRTAGAGHMVNSFPVGNGFMLGVSITRVSDPATGREWEQVGVQPDLAVPAEAALAEAHADALRRLIAAGSDTTWRPALERILAVVEARRSGRTPEAAWLGRLAGDYEGRVVSAAGGRLYYARTDGAQPEELVWLGDNRFGIGATLYRFEDGRLTIESFDGTRLTLPRKS